MDQWPDVEVTKGLQWLTWVCQQGALKDKGVEACKFDSHPIFSKTQSIFSFLSRPCWVSCPSKLDCLVDANGFNPAIYCGLENNLWLLAWVILDKALLLVIVFASAIVYTVSHQPGPPFNKLASQTLWWRQIVFYNLCHWPGPQQSDQYWARFARRHCRWKVDQICHGFCWLLPNNQEAIPLEDLPFSFDSHTSICPDTLYAHTAWQYGCGCVANVNEIAIKRPQRNQSLLPLDRSRCFRVVYPLYPVSVSLDGLGHEKMNTCCKKKIWGKNHESLLPKIFFTRIASSRRGFGKWQAFVMAFTPTVMVVAHWWG